MATFAGKHSRRCEASKRPASRCRCRCGGEYHGSAAAQPGAEAARDEGGQKVYEAIRGEKDCVVRVSVLGAAVPERPGERAVQRRYWLPARLDLWNHSPLGFEWGYAGSGPAQLALALLADCTGDEGLAVRRHQDFKVAVLAGAPREGFTLTGEAIEAWLKGKKGAFDG